MAEIDNYLLGPSAKPEDEVLGTAGDFAKTLGAGAARIGSNVAGGARYLAEGAGRDDVAALAKNIQSIFSAGDEAITDTINPATRKLAASELTSDAFWEHPVLATSLKATGMLPSIAAAAIPGGLMADALGATLIAAGAGGALNAADGVDEFYKKLDAMSDSELQEQSPKFKAMRQIMDEGDARKRFNREAQGWGPTLNLLIGAAGGALGPAGTAARAMAGGAKNAVLGAGERGAIGSAAIAAGEGVATNALEEGVNEVTQQSAEIDADMRKEFDRARVANAALEGGYMGGLFGSAVGAVTGGHTAPKVRTADIETTTAVPSPQVKNGSTGTPAKPAEIEANPQNAPTTTPRDMGKDDTRTAPAKPVAPQPETVSSDIAAAIASNNESKPAPKAAPTEVAAMEQRSPNETLDILDQEGAPAPAQVTPPGNEAPAPAPALDTGLNVPEQPQSIAEQITQIGTGDRKAAMVPKGTVVPADLLGGRKDLRKHRTTRGTFIYDPKLTTPAEIQKLSKAGRENELLGLGPVSKPAAVADAAAGATPVAITERTPTGTEVKAAAGTTATLPEQAASLEAQKTPGNVVAVESPAQVVAARQNGSRVLRDLRQTDEERAAMVAPAPPEAPPIKDPDAAGPGKNYRGKAGQERDARIAHSKDVVGAYQPDAAAEEGYHRLPAARDAVVARLRAMVADAEKRIGKPIQSQIKRSAKGDAASDDANVLLLRIAKDVVKTADKHPQGKAITDAVTTFKSDEALIRAGETAEVIARRLEEGDRASRKTGGAENDIEQHADTNAARPDVDENLHDEAPVEGIEEVIPDQAGVRDATDEGVSAREHEDGLSDSEEIVQGPSVKHIEVKQEKATSGMTAREARKAALAGLKPVNIKNDAIFAARKAKVEADVSRVMSEPLVVNRNPTEAQKRAGNYKKGHRSVEGLPFTIENPKGAIRRGGEPGNEWSVRMPADYGYIRRTVGADGDHVDAYDGRNGNKFFIVDQLDERTGKFDEHKVMMRFKDEQTALDAYHAAFSDGKGPQRMGFIHEVSADELKTWLNGDTTEPMLDQLTRDFDKVKFDAQPGGRLPVEAGNGVQVWPVRSSNAAAELDALDLSNATGINAEMAKFMQSKLRRLAGEVPVHYVTEKDMTALSPNAPGALGLHVRNRQTGHSELYLLNNIERGADHGQSVHVLLHELTHAVTVNEIDKVPGAYAMIERLAKFAHNEMSLNLVELDLTHGTGTLDYGFTNPKEFIAEAFSNPRFQDFLSSVPITDPELVRYLGIGRPSKMSAWDVLRKFVQKAIEKITGKIPGDASVLDGILKVGEHLTSLHEVGYPSPYARGRVGDTLSGGLAQQEAFQLTTRAAESVKRMLDSREANVSAPKALKLRTFDNIAQIADHYFGENNPVRKIHSAIERMRVKSEQIAQQAEPVVRKLAELRAKNRAAYEEMSSLMHDATVANVHPDVALTDVKNAHLGKDALRGVWNKAQHAELAKRFRALPEEYQAAFHETTKYFRDEQNKMSLGIIQNQVLKLLGHDDAALAQRVHEGNLTDADRTLLGSNADILEEAGELSKIEGPYVPLMRRGDHVVKGDYKVTSPGNAKVISNKGGDVEFEFTTRKEAEDYAKGSPLQVDVKKIWVDDASGERNIPDGNGGEHRVTSQDLNAVDRYRVKVRNRHVEFVQGKSAAIARASELSKDGNLAVHEVVPRSREPEGRAGTDLSTSLQRLVKKLEKSNEYQASTPTQKAALRQAIEEAALASHGSTRVSSRALPRRGVAGFSEDLVQNTVDYAGSSSRYLAKLDVGPQLEEGLKEMAAQLDRDHSKTGQYARTAISNEVRDRVEGDNGYQQGGALAPVVKRLLSASFTDKLASPAYSIINAMQPGMVTMPYLSGKYGVGRAFGALGKAYADINAGSVLKEGVRGTGKAIKGQEAKHDLMSLVKRKLSDDERKMLDYQIAEGTIDANAGMEVTNIARSYEGAGGKADAVLGYLEGVTREMPRAIETINRAVTALATYRLERSKGASHDVATRAAQDAVNSTQFNYSPTNSPAVFNHPLLKIALQFKKYGQGMYQLIGTQIGQAMRNAEPGDRQRAVKTLMGIAATHMAMAGALGLPTEPFKYLVMGTSMVTGVTWSDVENEIRRKAATMFGKTGGEVLTRGLPRFLNLDLSRMGLDSVTSFGEPKGNKEADVKSWLFDSVSGPVVSLGGDYIKGANLLANGEITKAAEKLIPLKAASDSIRAYRQASEGKKTAAGKQSSEPYSATEAGMRVLGFGNAREAEEGAQRSAYFRESSKAKEERGGLVNGWVNAEPTAKAKAWAAIQKFNQTAPAESKITAKELTSKSKRDAKAAQTSTLGITPNKRDKRFLEEGIYNVR